MSWSGFQLRIKFTLLKTFYENGECTTHSAKTPNHFLKNKAPYGSIGRRLMTKFEIISSVLTAKSPGRKRSSLSEEQLVLVQDSVTVSPKKSICRSWISRPLHCIEFWVA